MEIKALKPCPLCGAEARITESRLSMDNVAYAKIECACGLTFEKEWYNARVKDGFVILNDNICIAWNRRVK